MSGARSRRALLLGGAGAIALVSMRRVRAQAFPSRPIEWVVPYPPGGSADVLARLLGPLIAQRLGAPSVVVINKPGAGTVIGTGQVAKAPPDGHTILFISNSFVINAKLRKNLPYDGMKAFAPVALMVNSPQVITVAAASPHASLKAYLDAARAKPGTVSMGSLGPATTQHIAVELLMRAANAKLVYVPYAGGAPAVTAALGAHVDAVLANYAEVAAHVEAGKLRVLAVTTTSRLPALPSVPTVAETGLAGYEAVAWFGVAAPAATPAAIVERIADAIGAALREPDVQARLDQQNVQAAFLGPAAFGAHIAHQYERYARVIDEANIQAD